MKLKVIAAAVVALSAFGAQAGTWAWDAHDVQEHALQFSIPAGSIGDFYTFTLSAQTDVTSSVLSNGILGGTYSLWSGSVAPGDSLIGTWGQNTAATTVSLAAGSYYYFVGGFTTGTSGVYSIASTAVATPVPEPETYALLGAGLGIVGFVASRRRRDF